MTATTSTTTTTTTGTRLFALDNLRVLLTVLVVAHHAAITYGNIPVWFYTEPAKDPSGAVLDVLVVVNQAFFMGFFFLISGFFTPGSYDRKAGRTFVRDRLVRLGIPLIVFLVLLRPLLMPPVREGFAYWQWYLVTWDPGPLWFVEVLLVFALGYALWRRQRGTSVPDAEPRPLTFRAVALFALGLALVTFLWRFPVPQTSYVPILGLPTPYFLPQYVAMFVAGTLAFRRGWFASLPRRAGWIGFTAAGLATAAYLPVAGAANPVVVQAATTLWESVFAVGIMIGLVVLFRRRFNAQGRFGRFLSAHAYTVYIVHPFVLVAVAKVMRPLEAVAVAKFALLLVLAAPLCWGLAYAVRSIPGAKRVL